MTPDRTPAGAVEPDPEPELTSLDALPSGEEGAFGVLLGQLASAPAIETDRIIPAGEAIGDYDVVALLGKGAYGSVYRAVHRVLGREVAIKVLSKSHATEPLAISRFIEEARTVNRIRHENIVDVFGFGERANGEKFFVMELLEGATLGWHLRARGAFAPHVALHVLEQVAAALDAAHDHAVLHRDLKPENVFVIGALDDRCHIKLLDFGVAKVLDNDSVLRTAAGSLVGTPAYMSPEQCASEPLDRRSDIYALGVIAYEVFTGHRPFPGRNTRELMAQHLFTMPIPPSRTVPELSPALDEAVLAALRKHPRERPSTAREAVAAMGDALSNPRTARPPLRSGVIRRVHEPEKPWRLSLRWMLAVATLGGLTAWLLARALQPSAPQVTDAIRSDLPQHAQPPTAEPRAEARPPEEIAGPSPVAPSTEAEGTSRGSRRSKTMPHRRHALTPPKRDVRTVTSRGDLEF